MLTALIVTVIVAAALVYALVGRGETLIARRPYNNRYSDAAGAREDHLG